jgi:ABC-type transport system substrate-binding protein
MATKVEEQGRLRWTFTIRKDTRWSDNSPVTARDFEWSWKRQLDPASAAPYASFLYDIKNAEKFNKKQLTDAKEVGVRAKDDWTLEYTQVFQGVDLQLSTAGDRLGKQLVLAGPDSPRTFTFTITAPSTIGIVRPPNKGK